MAISVANPRSPTLLRQDAEARLKSCTAPRSAGWVFGTDALTLLYNLASSPDKSADAVKLLHELQTHQVELDLQYEQLEANEHALAEDLARYKALFDYAPAGYFMVSLDGHIIDGNLAGAELFGMDRDDLGACPVSIFLAPESRPALEDLLLQLQNGSSRVSCGVHSVYANGGSQPWQITATVIPGGNAILMDVSIISPQ